MQARWQEIDLDAKIWALPAERMKAGREHRVPLSDRAVAILREMKAGGVRRLCVSRPASGPPAVGYGVRNVPCGAQSEFTTHGFRSSFRDWAGNETNFPRELAEHALAHVIGDKAEQAYRRSDALARRRELMDAWARHCEGGAGDERADVQAAGVSAFGACAQLAIFEP